MNTSVLGVPLSALLASVAIGILASLIAAWIYGFIRWRATLSSPKPLTRGQAVHFALEIQLLGVVVGIIAAFIAVYALMPLHH
jgi:hypothetical protein